MISEESAIVIGSQGDPWINFESQITSGTKTRGSINKHDRNYK